MAAQSRARARAWRRWASRVLRQQIALHNSHSPEKVSPRRWLPFPYWRVLRFMADPDMHAAIRGDGSRRRCAEGRQGLRDYKHWVRGEPWPFAQYLFNGSEYPKFDWEDVIVDLLAWTPVALTVDYSLPPRSFGVAADTFGSSDRGGQIRPRIAGASVDQFARHRRWQDLIGENAPNAKLTEPQVIQIRERYAAGGISMARLAREHGVSQGTVSGIVWGSLWIYAPGPVKQRQLLRSRCTQEQTFNAYGERTHTEDHPRPEMLTETESAVINHCEVSREEDRYVSRSEIRAWRQKTKIEYDWGVYDPTASVGDPRPAGKGQ